MLYYKCIALCSSNETPCEFGLLGYPFNLKFNKLFQCIAIIKLWHIYWLPL